MATPPNEPARSPRQQTLGPLAGRVRIVRALPQGSSGESFVGESEGGEVVVKILDRVSDAEAQTSRLLVEAEALFLADCRGVVSYDEALVGEGGRAYLVRPYVKGRSLAEVYATRRPTLFEALAIGRAILEVLVEMHAVGVIHRNLKPANVIVRDDDAHTIALVDAGLSHDLSASERRERLVALARYVSPEQAGLLYQGVQESTDLYLFGLVLFEAIAGAPAFDGTSFGDVLRHHLTVPAPSPSSGGLRLPRAVDDLLARLLRKDPRDRYRTAAGVLGDLDEIMQRIERGEADPDVVIGASDRRERLTEPGFIGRSRELAALCGAMEDARRGMGALVCVEAESGGGKTRLLDELARRAEQRGLWVLRGRGQDLVASRPFLVLDGVVEEIASHAREHPDEAAALRGRLDVRAEHAAIALPALADVLLEAAPPEAGPEAFGETRTLQAVSRLFDALGAPDRPVIIILDDCQWADELTVKLLMRWTAHPPASSGRYVSIVAAYRSEEVHADHAIRMLPVRQITLAPFTTSEVHGIVESMAGSIPEEASDLVVRLAQGNPFMAGAVLRGLVETGALTADTSGWRIEAPAIADVRSSGHAVGLLHRRLELLPVAARQLLTAAAVLGKEFDLIAAQALARQGSAQALAALADARARHIVWPSARDRRYVFTHDKLRETLLQRLREDERRRLHLEAAVRLEQNGERPVYDLAYHFDAAGEAKRAFVYALAAADEARARNALEIAERYYHIAERGSEGEAAETRYRVAVGLGDVLMLRGHYEEAATAFEHARACADKPLDRAELEGKVGELAFKRGDPRQGYLAMSKGLRLLGRSVPRTALGFALQTLRELFVQALHTLAPSLFVARTGAAPAEDLVAIRLYNRLAYAFWFTQGTTPTLWAHLRGMNLAERYPPTAELAQAYSEHAPVATMIPWFDRGRRYAQRSLDLRKDLADVWGQGQSLHFLGIVDYADGRYRDGIEHCREAARILDRTGDRWEAFTARWHTAICQYRLGDLAAAVSEARRAYEGAVEIGDRQIRGITLGIWAKASEGRVPEDLLRRELAEESDDVHTTAELLMAEATRLLRIGRAAQAVEVLREARARVREKGLRQEYVAPVLPWLATALRTQAEQVPAWAAAERRALRRRLRRAVRAALGISRWYRNNLPHALREAGYLAAMDGRTYKARAMLEQSLEAAHAQSARYEEALTLEAIARVGASLEWRDASDARMRAERLLAETREGLEDGGGETGRPTLSLVDRFASLVESGRRIASGLSVEAVHAATCQALATLLRCEESAIVVLDEADPAATARLGAGKLRGPVCPALIERAVADARPMSYDADNPQGLEEAPELTAVASALCVPVVSRGRTVACLYCVHRHVAGLFGEDEERLAAFIATIAGAALENAEGFGRLQDLNALLNARGKELERSNRELSQFAYIASHDLQEPLRNVASYVQLLEERYKGRLDEKADRYIHGAVEGVNRMRTLIHDLLAYSRVTTRPKPMEPTELSDVFDEVAGTFAPTLSEAGAEVTRGDLPLVVADRTQMAQVFQNLLSNALKFRGPQPPRIHVWAERTSGEEWTVSMRDNGIGIDPKYAEQIFIIFKRLHTRNEYPGTGIGLAICAKIVERHGGRIWVESKVGEGATFRFTLPVASFEPRTSETLLS